MSGWYYRKQTLLDETTEGPLTDAEFLQLAFDGRIVMLVRGHGRSNADIQTGLL